MGYNTEFDGEFTLSKSLDEDTYYKLEDLAFARHDEEDMPSIWCQWVVGNDWRSIRWKGDEKFYGYIGWIRYINSHFLLPKKIKLNGTVIFQVEASEVAAAVAKGYSDQTCSRSQFVTLNRGRGQNIKYKPCAFTEHGIIMLASVLRSHEATQVSLRIVRAFVAMRKFILANAQVFQRIESVEQRQIATEGKVNEILNRLNVGDVPSQGVFYNGQLWDARGLVLKLIQSAKRSLILIDNWANTEVLDLFAKKRKGVRLTIFTSEHYDKKHVPHRKISPADVKTFNAQYPKLAVRYNETFHDRFLIIDDKELYLIGASLKDLGSKCFAFTKLDPTAIRGIKKSAFHPEANR